MPLSWVPSSVQFAPGSPLVEWALRAGFRRRILHTRRSVRRWAAPQFRTSQPRTVLARHPADNRTAARLSALRGQDLPQQSDRGAIVRGDSATRVGARARCLARTAHSTSLGRARTAHSTRLSPTPTAHSTQRGPVPRVVSLVVSGSEQMAVSRRRAGRGPAEPPPSRRGGCSPCACHAGASRRST